MEKLIFCNLDMLKPELDEDDYEGYDNAIWDQEANAFDGNMIYTDLFLYDVIHFDPLLWDVEDGVFVLKVPQIV